MTDDFVFGGHNKIVLAEVNQQLQSELYDYDHYWRERKASEFQDGTKDNAWWYQYRKHLKERGIITELVFTVNSMYEAI